MKSKDKKFFESKIKKLINKPFKIRFIKVGKYKKPECWIYPLDNNKQQKQKIINGKLYNLIDKNGKPIMETKSGLLITLETVESDTYLKEILENCF